MVRYQQIGFFRDYLLRNVKWRGIASKAPEWIEPVGYPTGISVYNSVSNSKVPLTLRHNKCVSWYMCGPTVYDSAHIGHACCYVKFDIIRRILMNFFDLNVVLVMGITDIDDKIIARARVLNENINTVSFKYENEFFSDMLNLNVLLPTVTVRVTDSIPNIIDFIKNILDKGLAYKTSDGSVYFDTSRCNNYGKFQQVGVDINTSVTEKKSSHDFALWKGSKPNEPFWSSPWGNGRPGWHIECSAIASRVLGSEIDLHSGGLDLLFPHHENEEAQSCAYHGVNQWVNYWLHTGHLYLKGDEKMSKSLKNTVSIVEFLKSHSGDHFRMFCLLSRYRNNTEYTNAVIEHASKVYRKLESFLSDCDAYIKGNICNHHINELEFLEKFNITQQNFVSALADDFDTPKAIGFLMDFVSETQKLLHSPLKEHVMQTGRSAGVIALAYSFVQSVTKKFGLRFLHQESVTCDANATKITDLVVNFRSEVRDLALRELKSSTAYKERTKDILKACDDLRNNLKVMGVEIKDHGLKSSWSKNHSLSQ